MPGTDSSPREDWEGRTWVTASAHVLADPETLYLIWRKAEKSPLESSNTGKPAAHPKGNTLKWDSEILKDQPGRCIVWRSGGHGFGNGVIFDEAPDGRGTLVTVLQEFRIGKLEKFWRTVTGRDPKQEIIENLEHFKARAETGESSRG
jgi:uncharacterized membrane protein